jgi:hypothetical protein
MAKTVKIEALKTRANFFFQHSGDDYRQARRTLQSFVEGFLHDANAYKGFRYLTRDEMKPGFSIGVSHGPNGPEFPDESRVSFY